MEKSQSLPFGSNYGSITWKNPQLLSFGSNYLSNILNYHRTMNYHRAATKGLCIKLFKLSGNDDQPQQFGNLWNTGIYGRNANSVRYAFIFCLFSNEFQQQHNTLQIVMTKSLLFLLIMKLL